MNNYPLAELFTTLQGEGPSVGRKAVFVRFQGCPLACQWTLPDGRIELCDSAYTWKPGLMQKAKMYSLAQIVDYMVQQMPIDLVVITGGEPMIRPELVDELAKEMISFGNDVEIETSGIRFPLEWSNPHLQYNVSPKLSLSGNARELRYEPDVIDEYVGRCVEDEFKAIFKFVVTRPEDYDEIRNEWEYDLCIPKDLIYTMPACVTAKDQIEMLKWMWPLNMKYGYRLSPRLHVFPFEKDLRGV